MYRFLSFLLFIGFWTGSSQAQQNSKNLENYSLDECINYAIENRVEIKNAQIDNQIAKAKVGEVRAMGLPQVNASLALINNYKVPVNFLPAQFLNPQAPEGEFVPVTFQPQYIGQAQVELQQLVFSGSYILGLKAASTYTQLTEKQITQSKIEVAEAVNKAYYSVLINQERLGLLKQNYNRLDTLYIQTSALFENGFAEKIDADRIKVAKNNIQMEMQNFERMIELTMALLKFQMGLNPEDNLTLNGKIADIELQESAAIITEINPELRIEYSLLQTQKDLNILQNKEYKSRYLPTLGFFINYGSNMGSSESKDLVPFGTDRWVGNGAFGINLSIPIFDGLQKHYLLQQGKLDLQKTNNQLTDFTRVVNLQVRQAQISLQNNLDKLKFQKENMELANEVFRVSKIKYEEGIGSNLEVVEAETDYKEAQTNYYAALYDAMIAKIDLDKAMGTLKVSNSK